MLVVLVVIAAFLAGSIPFGVLLGRLRGVELQQHGSGNIGAANAARVLGRGVGALVLLLDLLKGLLPVVLARHYLAPTLGDAAPWALAGVALAAVLGHMYTPWLGGRGGKGVATACGVFLALAPNAVLLALGVFAVTFALWRVASLGSLLGASALVLALWRWHQPLPIVLLGVLVWALIVVKHRANIRRLLAGNELKL